MTHLAIALSIAVFSTTHESPERPDAKIAAPAAGLTPQDEAAADAQENAEDPWALRALIDRAASHSPVLRQSMLEQEQASVQLADARMRVAREALEVFQDLTNGRDQVRVSQQLLEQTKTAWSAGRVTQTEVLQAQSAFQAADHRVQTAHARAQYLMGRTAVKDEIEVPANLNEFLEQALGRHPQIQLETLAVELARAKTLQVRLAVERDLTLLTLERQVLAGELELVQHRLEETKRLRDNGFVGADEFARELQALAKAQIELSKLEAQIRFLTGEMFGED